MASISNITPGIGYFAPPPPPPKAKAKPKTVVVEPRRCKACNSLAPKEGRYKRLNLVDGMCMDCASLFGFSVRPGCTDATPCEALKKINGVKENGFLLMLRDLRLGTPDGATITIQAGDVFQCTPSNVPPAENPSEPASKQRTWSLFVLSAQVGPYDIKLFPHEYSPISFRTVMECRKSGELVEQFMSADDKTGHFTPTPEIREQIVAAFGHMIGATA